MYQKTQSQGPKCEFQENFSKYSQNNFKIFNYKAQQESIESHKRGL